MMSSSMFKTILFATANKRGSEEPIADASIQAPHDEVSVEGEQFQLVPHPSESVDDFSTTPPVRMVVVSEPLSYVNLMIDTTAAESVGGNNKDASHDDNEDSSLETISSESVVLPSSFKMQQVEHHETEGSINNKASIDDGANGVSSLSTSLPRQMELSLRASQVTSMSQVELESSHWDHDDDVQEDFVKSNELTNSFGNGALCSKKPQWVQILATDDLEPSVPSKPTSSACIQPEQHNLDALISVGMRMQDADAVATQIDDATVSVPVHTKDKEYSTSFKIKVVCILLLALAAGRLFPAQNVQLVSPSSGQQIMEATDEPTPFSLETLMISTTNWTADPPTASNAAVGILVHSFVSGIVEDPLVAPQQADAAFQGLVTEMVDADSSTDSTIPRDDGIRATSGWVFLVTFAIIVVKLRPAPPTPPTPECYKSEKLGSSPNSPVHRPNMDPRIKIEPTTWMLSLNKDDDLDLYTYESMKVVELRQLLRERKCNTDGTKDVLIRRLVTVYQAELATLTVQQLRPKLRSRGCKQGGKKVDLIRRLVEVGL